jgi:hypothetical protein
VEQVKLLSASINDFVKPRLEQGLDGLHKEKEGKMGPVAFGHVTLLAEAMKDVNQWNGINNIVYKLPTFLLVFLSYIDHLKTTI